MAEDPFTRWSLRPVINAAGTMTAIGASRVPAEIRAAVDGILGVFVEMDALQARASRIIARLTGAPAGCVTGCSAAGLTQAVAACLTGRDLARIEALPRTGGERRVLLPAGQSIHYGAPLEQAIRLTGAEVVPVGTAAACETWHLRDALQVGAVAAVYVVSHHTVRENELPLDLYTSICRAHGVPVIADMASEYDLRGPIAQGVSAAIYSGHKFLGGPTSGIVAGHADLVAATYLQHRGIGRTMKAGKEAVAGAMAALEAWETRDHDAVRRAEARRVTRWIDGLSRLPGVRAERHADWTGNPITRARLRLDPAAAGCHAWDLARALAGRHPAIAVRDDLAEREEIYLDPCNLTDAEADLVAEAVAEEHARLAAAGPGRSWSEVKAGREAKLTAWPGDDAD